VRHSKGPSDVFPHSPTLTQRRCQKALVAIFSLTLLQGWMPTAALAEELKKVNEICSQLPCESGLYCVETRDGKKKCAACDQSKLNEYSRDVDNYCKAFGKGWTPESSDDYQAALAPDGRAQVEVYDRMLDSAKKCKEARTYREGQCWNKGDDDHKTQINQVSESIDRIASHKYKMVGDRRVFYCSKSTYQSKLSTFLSKCDLNFSDINQKLNIMNNEQDKKNKVSCSEIERYSNDCERCFDSAKDLLSDGFSGSSGKFPEEYSRSYAKGEETMKKAKDLLQTVKSRNLCN
jgi:hypothetical protein